MSKWQTIDHGTSVDVVPLGKLEVHAFGDECYCVPVIERTTGVPVITHHNAQERDIRHIIQEYAIDFHNSYKENYPAPNLEDVVTKVTDLVATDKEPK